MTNRKIMALATALLFASGSAAVAAGGGAGGAGGAGGGRAGGGAQVGGGIAGTPRAAGSGNASALDARMPDGDNDRRQQHELRREATPITCAPATWGDRPIPEARQAG
jgi:hypothetical protein